MVNFSRSTICRSLISAKNHTIEIVIDRLLVKPGIAAPLEQSIATALKACQRPRHRRHRRWQEHTFSEKLLAPIAHFRSRARAAFVQLQFALGRLPGLQWPRFEV